MDAVKEYRKRRRARLAANFMRLDDDDDTNNRNQNKGGGHGNTRIPFGLCQREGIQVGKDWTPKDAWNALEGKGYSASAVYTELKKTGKVGAAKKETPKAPEEPKAPEAPKISKTEYKKLKKACNAAKRPYNAAIKKREEADEEVARCTRAVDDAGSVLNSCDTYIESNRNKLRLIDSGDEIAKKRWNREDVVNLIRHWEDEKANYQEKLAERQKNRESAMEAQSKALDEENALKAEYEKAKAAYIAPIKRSPEYKAVKQFRANEEELMFARMEYNEEDGDLRYAQAQKKQCESQIARYKAKLEEPDIEETTRKLYTGWLEGAEKKLPTYTAMVEDAGKRVANARQKVVNLESKASSKADFDDEMWDDAYKLTTEESVVQENKKYVYLNQAAAKMKSYSVKYKPVTEFFRTPTEKEAIKYVAGGDETSGSCVSCAMAYLACKSGFNVLDFRGGASQNVMSVEDRRIIMALGGAVAKDFDGFKAAHSTLGKITEENKEYFFVAGSHAAIVKKESGQLKFLELQSEHGSGWFPLDDRVLKNRFSCHHSRTRGGTRYECASYIIEAEKMTESDEFISLLGYINTDPAKQKKGGAGGVK